MTPAEIKEIDWYRRLDAAVHEHVMGGKGGLTDPKFLLAYSTDIAAAWLAWEKLPSPKRLCEGDPSGLDDPEYHWYVVLCGGSSYGPQTDCVAEFKAVAPTAPLAICKAALRAVGVKVPNHAK